MKKLTTITAALALFFSAAAFTPDSGKNDLSKLFNLASVRTVAAADITKRVASAFNQKYSKARNVTWTQAQTFYFASFDVEEGNLSVAYTETGEFVAICRKISLNQLPMATLESIKEVYGNYVIPATVSEIVLQGQTNYYLTVEGKSAYLKLKCSPDGDITVERRIKKKVLVGKVY